MKNIDIYPTSRTPDLSVSEFAKPSAVFRGTPFWSWNTKLNRTQLRRQIDYLKQMGFGGYHIHPRSGLATEYMSREYLEIVKDCVEYGQQQGMLTWLYDEDRWPSGFAGGLVTRDEQFRARYLLFTPHPYSGVLAPAETDSLARGSRAENGTLIAVFAVALNPDGTLASYRRIQPDQVLTVERGFRAWYAYCEIARPSPWYNGFTYVDTLNPAAVRRFIEVTHERYDHELKQHFGHAIPAIFTDEPQFSHKGQFHFATETRDIFMPWTDDLPTTFKAAYGQELLDHLPELFWELPERKPSVARYRYHDHIAERFASAYADTIGNWCARHHVALTGHMMEEPTLQSQTAAVGDAMRSYRSFQVPGIDILCDWREYTTAKQAQSAAHQFGCSGVLSELYGVTDWDFPFLGHKGQGDWQAALGVTVRVHHLAWVSMAGEAKRDYPASIFYQSPWYREYPLVEDHFARLNTVLTRGRPGVRVGVIHPIESYWLAFGPLEQTKLERAERQTNFSNLTEWLLFGLIDFDFICESLLPELSRKQEGNALSVGRMQYDVVVVPAMRTIRNTTLKRLERFAKDGGQVIFAGEVPSLVDAVPSARAQRLAKRTRQVAYTRPEILEALEGVRELDVRLSNGGRAESLLHQFRDDGEKRRLFICNTDRKSGFYDTLIKVRGQWSVENMDTFTGTIAPEPAAYHAEGWTVIPHSFEPHSHLLLTFNPTDVTASGSQSAARMVQHELARLDDPVPVTLSEPNTLLLDQAEWRINDGAWQPREEILRLENLARREFGLAPKTGQESQPWADAEPVVVLGTLSLRFKIVSEVALSGLKLALEDAAEWSISLDRQKVEVARNIESQEPAEYFVDEAIQTLALPFIEAGAHTLELTIPYHRKTNVEWCYLLGDFGVNLAGRHAHLTAPVRRLAFGDATRQGLPFYTGNITYHCRLPNQLKNQDAILGVPHFKNPVLAVSLNGQDVGRIAFAPFRLALPPGAQGDLDITCFGHRFNAFGAVHWINPGLWVGPNAWRTQGDQWSYEYQLKPTGILSAPVLLRQTS